MGADSLPFVAHYKNFVEKRNGLVVDTSTISPFLYENNYNILKIICYFEERSSYQ